MAERLLIPKKKRPKSPWMKGFVLLPANTDIDKVQHDRMEMCSNIRNKRIQHTGN